MRKDSKNTTSKGSKCIALKKEKRRKSRVAPLITTSHKPGLQLVGLTHPGGPALLISLQRPWLPLGEGFRVCSLEDTQLVLSFSECRGPETSPAWEVCDLLGLCFSAVLMPKCSLSWTGWTSTLCEDSAKTSSETLLLRTTIRHQLAFPEGDANKKPFTSNLSGNQVSKQGANHSSAVCWCLATWTHLKRDKYRLCTVLFYFFLPPSAQFY